MAGIVFSSGSSTLNIFLGKHRGARIDSLALAAVRTRA